MKDFKFNWKDEPGQLGLFTKHLFLMFRVLNIMTSAKMGIAHTNVHAIKNYRGELLENYIS